MKNERRRVWNCKASYTVEAAVYIPIILFVLLQTLEIAIDEWQESKERQSYVGLEQLDIVSEFYGYQILGEVQKEIEDD